MILQYIDIFGIQLPFSVSGSQQTLTVKTRYDEAHNNESVFNKSFSKSRIHEGRVKESPLFTTNNPITTTDLTRLEFIRFDCKLVCLNL